MGIGMRINWSCIVSEPEHNRCSLLGYGAIHFEQINLLGYDAIHFEQLINSIQSDAIQKGGEQIWYTRVERKGMLQYRKGDED
jgi:hypothetical protein